MKVTEKQRQAINNVVEDLYQEYKAKLLGRLFKGPQMWFEVVKTSDPHYSLEGLFRYALHHLYGPGADVDEKILKKLASVTSNYLDAERLRTANDIDKAIDQAETADELKGLLGDIFSKATDKIETITVTEARNFSSLAERDGISQLAATIGIEDPTVAKLGPLDAKTCKVCLKLWHDDSNPKVPKLYKLSELRGGYSDNKNPTPTFLASHPNCRHITVMIAPNYGFDENGNLHFKTFGHDEYAVRRGLGKSESFMITNTYKDCDCGKH